MLNQMYYNVKNRLEWRLTALTIMVLGNIFMMILMRGADTTSWQAGLAMTFAGLSFFGVFIVSIIVTGSNSSDIFKSPKSYLTMLTPVPTWKIHLGWMLPSIVIDIISVGIAVVFIFIMGTQLTADVNYSATLNVLWHVIPIVLVPMYYGLLLSAGVFWEAVTRGVLHNVPMRKFIGGILTILALLALSWSNILLGPLGEVSNVGLMFNVAIHNAEPWHVIPVGLLVFAQAAILFVVAVKLIDRSFNT